MENQSVVVFEKPLQHLALDDWNNHVQKLRSVADARRNDAFEQRYSARDVRNETAIHTKWDTLQNNSRLSDRVEELDRWCVTLESCLESVRKEIKLLGEEKIATEQKQEHLASPLSIVSECLTMRDSRLGSELTYDDGDTELKQELRVIENNHKMLTDQCHRAWQKLLRLEEVKFQLERELENKKKAHHIDGEQLKLNESCANISFKPDATRIPRNSCTYEAWLEHSKHIKLLADNELEDAYALRESLFVARERARNILRAQQDFTEYTIRKRIFETQRATNELQWQQNKMKEEMIKCTKEIAMLEQSLADKTNVLKLAETRLENRVCRFGTELCRDEVYAGLCVEVSQLKQTRRSLIDKIDSIKSTHHALEEHASLIATDLTNKQHSLTTDIRGLGLRAPVRSDSLEPKKTQTDTNAQQFAIGLSSKY